MFKGKFWVTEFSIQAGESSRPTEVLWGNKQAPPVQTEDIVLVSLYADGPELLTVRRMFPTWCPAGLHSCYWHGDIARTVLGCLLLRRSELLAGAGYEDVVDNENI